ncbi:MAG: hypothetical protein SNH88_00965 [Rikenellaceae bacterium]
MSCSPSQRKIASNLALVEGAVIKNPLLTIDHNEVIIAIDRWERVDSTPYCEFYSGLIFGSYQPYTPEPIAPLLAQLPRALKVGTSCQLYLLSGIDYERMQLTEHSQVERLP